MLVEVDEELHDKQVDLVICPVGVGSLAQAVVSHYKAEGRQTAVLTCEPDTAACLWTSLQSGKFSSLQNTGPTIMSGLDCGTVSKIAWPLLSNGVDASVTISDYECHIARGDLQKEGICAGPCGAAPLAALRRLGEQGKASLGLSKSSSVVLLCTEGVRDYTIPKSVSADDHVTLTQTLVQINSASPDLGSVAGPGELEIAAYVKAWLDHRDIETHWIEPTQGRPSVIGIVRGTGGGKSIMLNGHIGKGLTKFPLPETSIDNK